MDPNPTLHTRPGATEVFYPSMQAVLFDDLLPGGTAYAAAFQEPLDYLWSVGSPSTHRQIQVHNCLTHVACHLPTIITVAWHGPTRRWWFTGLDYPFDQGGYTPLLSLPPVYNPE